MTKGSKADIALFIILYLASKPRIIPITRINTGTISSLPIHITKMKSHLMEIGLAAVT
jgi:DNA repair protein RadC